MTRRVPYFAVLIAAGAVLVGCVATPSAAPSPSPAGDSTVSPPPATTAPTEPEPDEIVIGPVGLEVLDAADEVLYAAAYGDPLADVVAGLEAVLGAPPVEGTAPGSPDRAPHATYTWDGLTIGEGYPEGGIAFDIRATGDATGGVRLRTPEGIGIGTDAETVRATYATYESLTDFDLARGPAVVVDESQSPGREFGVVVVLLAPVTAVDRIYAPTDSWGP